MRRFSITQLRASAEKAQVGCKIWINSINLSNNALLELRRMIQTGVLVPDYANTVSVYMDVEGVMSGNLILPQNYYFKAKGARK